MLRRHDHAAPFGAHHDLVFGILEIEHGDKAPSDPRRHQRRFVHEVGEIRTREARRPARDDAQIDIGAKRRLPGVNTQDLFTAFDVGVRHCDLTVEPARTQQRRVKHVAAVGGRDDDDALVGLKSVHLDQQLVQRLFTFVIATAIACTTMAAHGVDLVDENDTGRVLFRLLEHVADTACADTDEHLDKIRTRDREEGHARLTGNSPRKQRLTGTRRTNKKRAFWDFAAKAREFLRVAQELDDLFEFFLGLVDTGDIVKRDAALLFGQHLGLGLTKTHGATATTTLHPVHEIDPDADQQQERQKREKEGLEPGLLLLFGPDRDVVRDEKLSDFSIFRLDRHVVLRPLAKAHLLAVEGDVGHAAVFDGADEFGIADLAALQRVAGPAEEVEEGQNQQEQHDPEGDVSNVAQGYLLTNEPLAAAPDSLS